MESVWFDVEGRHLLVGDLDAFGIGVWIEFAADFETALRRCAGNQFDHGEATGERGSAPVLGDVAEHPVLDSVPLRCARRIMQDTDRQVCLVAEFLQLCLP